MHKEGYLTSDVIHVHEWNTTKKKKTLYHYYYYQQATVECTCTHSAKHYARNGYFNELIEAGEQPFVY